MSRFDVGLAGVPYSHRDRFKMKNEDTSRRVVVTGLGVVSALGATLDDLWTACREGRSGLKATTKDYPLPVTTIAPADCFTGKIQDFGAELDEPRRKAIRKGVKLMAREIQTGVAAAQLALQHAQLGHEYHPCRVGVSVASDMMITAPQEVTDAFVACRDYVDGEPRFHFDQWRENGIKRMTPLWQLKYLTNMSASHVTIYNEFFGPAFDVTNREASFAIAVSEAIETIKRGAADAMIVGATGSRLQPYRFVDALKSGEFTPEILRSEGATAPGVCRPFDARRFGTVPGEGAGALLLESESTAVSRGAKIYAEAVGGASRSVICHARELNGGDCRLDATFESLRESFRLTLRAIVRKLGLEAEEIGHINAAARGDVLLDAAEAAGLRDVLGDALDSIPTTTLSGHIGNPGAGGGAIQTIASILALEHDALFPILNYGVADSDCRVNATREFGEKPGDSFLKLCANAAGQTSAVYFRRYKV